MSGEAPDFDPDSPQFNFLLWTRKFMQMMENEGLKLHRAGFTFRNLNVSGRGSALQLQKNVGSLIMEPFRFREHFNSPLEKRILRDFNGHVSSGEILVVLGRPGSGCSTFLKSICGEMQGLEIAKGSQISYSGIDQATLLKNFKGEAVYNQENEKHFPHLTVGETLDFANSCRTPSNRPMGVLRAEFAKYVASIFGDDFVRCVSGGERKRVGIAEMLIARPPLAAWNNSTRGLDSQTALEFVHSFRTAADVCGLTSLLAVYQASQAIYDLCDKVIVLYEGHQIYFGHTDEARTYFEEMERFCPSRQTTGNFLTSITNPAERKPRQGFEGKVPRTPDDFEKYWKNSIAFKHCIQEIDDVGIADGEDKEAPEAFQKSH